MDEREAEKMKNMKTFLALVIAALMILTSASALAEGEKTITITAPTGHTYEIFQVFTGTVSGTQLESLKYGQNTSKTAGAAVAQADLETLAELSGTDATGEEGQALINTLEGFVDFTSTPVATVASETATEGLATGYYVIRDKMADLPNGEGATLYMFKVLNDNLTITAKSDKPSSEKKVQDINDSDTTPTLSSLQDSADYDIGDEIPYTLTFTLPADYANYEHYYVKFYDDMSKGLTYKTGSAEIEYGSNEKATIADPTAGTSSAYTGGNMWTWEIMDLKALTLTTPLAAGDTVVLTYKAVLNANAVIGEAGNPNTMKVEFSSNPNNTGDGTKKPDDTKNTPEDTNIVFTYKTVFNKVDEAGTPLEGADFELLKLVNDDYVNVTELNTGDTNPTKTMDGTQSTAAVPATGTEGEEGYVAAQPAVKGDAKVFTFTGLDDGTYKLVETVTPVGYNTMEPFIFKIVAEHDEEKDDPKLTKLEIQDKDGNVISGENLQFTATKSTGTAEADIENKSGIVLPSTGGIGTTIFYIGGSILVLAAVILLVTKRRMSAKD